MIVFNSNTALILVALITSIFGYLGIVRQTKRVKEQVQSPNGETTALAVQTIKKEVREIRSHQRRISADFANHLAEVEPMQKWILKEMAKDG